MSGTTLVKKGKKPSPRARRRGQVSGDDLLKLSNSLREMAGEFEAVALQMSEHGVDEIEIDGGGMADRGTEWLVKYLGKVSDALVAVRYGR